MSIVKSSLRFASPKFDIHVKLKELSSDISYKIVMYFIGLFRAFRLVVVRAFAKPCRKLLVDAWAKKGVTINGKARDSIQVLDDRFYERLLQDRSLGMGEAYMNGWWEVEDMEALATKMYATDCYHLFRYSWSKFLYYLQFDFFNLQTSTKNYILAEAHYNIGNELFESFTDSEMIYSCGYWKNAKNLEESQQHKMDLIARKLKLKPGMRVLDIGCGWGGLCKFLAKNYGVKVVGCTISVEGAKSARVRCQGLPVEIRVCDYREIDEKFDRIVSVGMFEHVGNHNYQTFFETVHRCLVDNGIFLLHTIGRDCDRTPKIEPWTNTYIFPNGRLPITSEITKSANRLFNLEDWHNFGHDYTKTLHAWSVKFDKNFDSIKHLYKNSDRLYRQWKLYFAFAFGGFNARKFELWQIVFTKNGLPGGYDSVR